MFTVFVPTLPGSALCFGRRTRGRGPDVPDWGQPDWERPRPGEPRGERLRRALCRALPADSRFLHRTDTDPRPERRLGTYLALTFTDIHPVTDTPPVGRTARGEGGGDPARPPGADSAADLRGHLALDP